MALPAYLHCTGPVFVWTDMNDARSIGQLGTCEQHPVNNPEFSWADVHNDLAGEMLPLDQQYEGQIESIILELNRFNWSVSNWLESAPGSGLAGGNETPGFESALSRGSYLLQNGGFFRMWLQYSYFGTVNAAAYPDMPPGIFYPYCRLAAAPIPKQGLKTSMKRLEVVAFPGWALVANGGAGYSAQFQDKSILPAAFVPIQGLVPS